MRRGETTWWRRWTATAGALLSPALHLWVAPGMPWWTLYAVWGAIIALAALAQRRA